MRFKLHDCSSFSIVTLAIAQISYQCPEGLPVFPSSVCQQIKKVHGLQLLCCNRHCANFQFLSVHNSQRIVWCWTKLITTRTVLVTRAKCANSLLTAAAYKTRHLNRTTPSHSSFSTSPLWLLLLLVTTWSREIFELHVRATNRARVSRFKSIKFHHFSLTHSLAE